MTPRPETPPQGDTAPEDTLDPEEMRCAVVAVIGAPNAGKSTLVNRLVGQKISIVTRKVQTTRARVRGVTMAGSAQLIFIDTPGIFAPRRRLDRAMVRAAWESTEDADATLLMVDSTTISASGAASVEGKQGAAVKKAYQDTLRILDGLKEEGRKAILVLNKIDRIARPQLLEVATHLHERAEFEDTFMISAETGDGVEDLRAALAVRAPKGPWLFPEDQIADVPQRMLAAEITREHLFDRIHDELPYHLTVETESWERTKKGDIRIEQVIVLDREAHKPIVLGKKGAAIKEIGAAARAELCDMMEETVHLFLRVKVREKWEDDPARYRQMGLDIVE